MTDKLQQRLVALREEIVQIVGLGLITQKPNVSLTLDIRNAFNLLLNSIEEFSPPTEADPTRRVVDGIVIIGPEA